MALQELVHFLHTIGIFEDPSSIQQIKAAVFKKHQSPVKMQGRQPRKVRKEKGDVQLMGKHLEKENTTEIDMRAQLSQKDMEIREKEDQIYQKDMEIREKEDQIYQKD